MNETEQQAQTFFNRHEPELYRLGLASSLASWDLYTQGGEDNVKKVQETSLAYLDYVKDPGAFAETKALRQPERLGQITSEPDRRRVDLLYKTFFWGNLNADLQKEIIDRSSRLEEFYNNFRIRHNGQTLSNTDANELFRTSPSPQEVEALWKARHEIGAMKDEQTGQTVAQQIVELARLRNRLAQEAGFDNYYAMVLSLGDIEEKQLDDLMQAVRQATDQPYRDLRNRLDALTTKHFGVSPEEVSLPWFQGNNALGGNLEGGNMVRLFNFDPDAHLRGRDPIPLLEASAKAMGTTIREILDKSDLYYDPSRPGKSQHWFCYGIDSPHDVRSIGNVDPAFQKRMGYAFSTLLHEVLGHGLDFAEIDPKLPAILRDQDSITTESNAMLIEALIYKENWLRDVLGLAPEEAKRISTEGSVYKNAQTLANIRAMMSIIAFERSMYRNPDQDLNALWWDIQEQYLFEKRPPNRDNPDWARIPHYAGAPAYYHNYFLAEVRRAQVEEYINDRKDRFPNGLLSPEVGDYLREHRASGTTYRWDGIVKRMTGQPLGVDGLMKQLNRYREAGALS